MGKFVRVLFVILLLPGQVCSQEVAWFTGVWRMDAERSESAHQAVPIGPVTLILKAIPTGLRIETRRTGKGKVRSTNENLEFRLDGSENVVSDNFGKPIKTKAHFDGPRLVTETVRNIQGSTVTSVQVFSLDASGNALTIDKTLTVQHGYQSTSPDANNAGKGRDVFVRSREGRR